MRAAYPGVWLLAWKPQKVSITGTIRPRAVFAQSEACYAAPCRLVRPESHKDGAVPYKTVERRVIQRYAVLCGLLWCYMDTGSNCMVQCGVIRRWAVQLEVRLQTVGCLGVNKRIIFCRNIRRNIRRYWILRRICRSISCSAPGIKARPRQDAHRRCLPGTVLTHSG
jgi:hypothetical protein